MCIKRGKGSSAMGTMGLSEEAQVLSNSRPELYWKRSEDIKLDDSSNAVMRVVHDLRAVVLAEHMRGKNPD